MPSGSRASSRVIDNDDGTFTPIIHLDNGAGNPVAWQAVSVNTIAVADSYQVLFPAGSAERGGYLANTSAPGSEPLWIDLTGATGGALSKAAMPVYPAPDTASAPGYWRIPPTTGAVTIMGPSGATFQAFSG